MGVLGGNYEGPEMTVVTGCHPHWPQGDSACHSMSQLPRGARTTGRKGRRPRSTGA